LTPPIGLKDKNSLVSQKHNPAEKNNAAGKEQRRRKRTTPQAFASFSPGQRPGEKSTPNLQP
jgi:hypothetical protein